MITIQGELKEIKAKTLASSDVGIRLVIDTADRDKMGELAKLMKKPLKVTIEII